MANVILLVPRLSQSAPCAAAAFWESIITGTTKLSPSRFPFCDTPMEKSMSWLLEQQEGVLWRGWGLQGLSAGTSEGGIPWVAAPNASHGDE